MAPRTDPYRLGELTLSSGCAASLQRQLEESNRDMLILLFWTSLTLWVLMILQWQLPLMLQLSLMSLSLNMLLPLKASHLQQDSIFYRMSPAIKLHL